MLDANDLIMFVRVVDAGSFTQAAERMDLPKSTLSRRLGLLEDTLGEKLFVRSTRRLAITEFGESILDHARRLVDEAEDVSALAQHRQATPRGELRISMKTRGRAAVRMRAKALDMCVCAHILCP
jgi:DNA-binding transcriptional LysR family regulator